MPQLYSNCCHVEMRLDYAKDICPACKEGCGVEEGEEEFMPMLADMLDRISQSTNKLNAALDAALARLSRKTRTLTKAEAEALLTEKLGKSVEIENE